MPNFNPKTKKIRAKNKSMNMKEAFRVNNGESFGKNRFEKRTKRTLQSLFKRD